MTKFFLLLTTVFSIASICHADSGDSYGSLKTTIKFGANLQSHDKDEYSGKYSLSVDLNEKCGIRVESSSIINLVEGQVLVGTSSAQDRVKFTDTEQIGSSLTTQVDFASSDQNINLTLACFDQGIVFRSVPSLSDLLTLVKNKKIMIITLKE